MSGCAVNSHRFRCFGDAHASEMPEFDYFGSCAILLGEPRQTLVNSQHLFGTNTTPTYLDAWLWVR